MARIKKTSDYLDKLQNKGYNQYNDLFNLYNEWKKELDIKSLSDFLNIIWKEKDNIKPKYLGENTYNNFRGIAFEEFCFDLMNKVIKEAEAQNIIELFWNTKILTEEFYMFENGQRDLSRELCLSIKFFHKHLFQFIQSRLNQWKWLLSGVFAGLLTFFMPMNKY